MTPQQKIKETLAKAGIPAREINVYGSQIMIVAFGREAADKWAALLSKFAKVRGVVESRDYSKANTNACLIPSSHKVWLVAACI